MPIQPKNVEWIEVGTDVLPEGAIGYQYFYFDSKWWLLCDDPAPYDIATTVDFENWDVSTMEIDAGYEIIYGVLCSFQNKLWHIGGAVWVPPWMTERVYYSSDGVAWTRGDDFSIVTYGPSLVVHDGKLWAIGGFTTGFARSKRVYYTEDGEVWIRVADIPYNFWAWAGATVSFDGKIWIIGAWSAGDKNKVSYTVDGSSWVELGAVLPYNADYAPGVASCGGRIWLIGGGDSQGTVNTAYSSEDGLSWTQGVNFPIQICYPGTFVHAGRLFAAGGQTIGGARSRKVFSAVITSNNPGGFARFCPHCKLVYSPDSRIYTKDPNVYCPRCQKKLIKDKDDG